MKIVFSAEAKATLREISLFIARDNPRRAVSFIRELREKAVKIGHAPLAYPLVWDFESIGLRCRSHGNYLIFYQIKDDQVFIVSVINAARDYIRLLFPGT